MIQIGMAYDLSTAINSIGIIIYFLIEILSL